MLEIQSQPQVKIRQAVHFKGKGDFRPVLTSPYDEFDREALEAERDGKLDEIDQQRRQIEELADELESSDSKLVKKTSKGVRFVASALGIVGTFVAAKYSSKVAIETLKTMAKNPSVQKAMDSLKGVKEPVARAAGAVKEFAVGILEKPKVKEVIDKTLNSRAVTAVKSFAKNEKVAKVLEPIKNTLKSVKEIKINGKSIQSAVENTMAATTAGSVLVDNITGRNNDKSSLEVASGV